MCNSEKKAILYNDQSPFDQDSFWGRTRQFIQLHNPFYLLRRPSTLEDARCLYLKFRCGEPLPEHLGERDMWKARALYQSAYNVETGEKIPTFARPGALIPMNMLLAGGLMALNKSPGGVVVSHWANQTYNAFAAYGNSGGDVPITETQLTTSYIVATATAIGTALGLHRLLRCHPYILRRFIPFVAVAAAHCVREPFIKAQVLRNGAPIYDDKNTKLGYSRKAAEAGISGSTLNKIMMALPPMTVTPLVMHCLEQQGHLCRYPWLNFPGHAVIAGLCLAILSPLACALLPHKGHMPSKQLEPEMQEYLCKRFYARPPRYVYYDRT